MINTVSISASFALCFKLLLVVQLHIHSRLQPPYSFNSKSSIFFLDHPPWHYVPTRLCSLSCNSRKHSLDWDSHDCPARENATDGPRLSGSYTFYIFQARPDLVSVQGFYADVKGVVFIKSSSDSVKIEPRAEFKSLSWHTPLLYALLSPPFHDQSYGEGVDQDAEFSHKLLDFRYHTCDSSLRLSVEGVASGLKKLWCLSIDGRTIWCEQSWSDVTQWCRHNRHQKSVSIGSTFQWGRVSSSSIFTLRKVYPELLFTWSI